MNIRPLEPGCLAVIIKSEHPEYIGTQVKCIEFTGQEFLDVDGDLLDYWHVESLIPVLCLDNTGKYIECTDFSCAVDCLMRIDGYKETEKEQQREYAPGAPA